MLNRIIHRITYLKVRLEQDGDVRVTACPIYYRRGKMEYGKKQGIVSPKEWAGKRPAPAAVVVGITGQGVIAKTVHPGDAIREKVIRSMDFLWEEYTGEGGERRLVFVRREMPAQFLETINHPKVAVVALFPVDEEGDGEEEKLTAVFRERLTFRNLLKTDRQAGQLAALLAAKVRIPVLACLFLMAALNFAIHSDISAEHNRLRSELAFFQKTSEQQRGDDRRLSAFLQTYGNGTAFPFSRTADRIASLLPEQVRLTELSLVPLQKNPEKGKPLQLQSNTVRLKGRTEREESVGRLTRLLSDESSFRQVRLTFLDKQPEEAFFTFEIIIEL
ncbi:MAG: PilN domain-containing protein [Culturomica sp.]|jgi:Tfp pilus assembly protein PilN|nr:PilN domain-containing protein [Culturomica sp.]